MNVATKEAKENIIGASPATRWWRPCMRVAVCLSIDQGELLGGHSGVEVGGRKGRGSDDESSVAQLPKSKASVRKEVDSEEHHTAVEADLPIAKEGMQMHVIKGREEVENTEANSKYQDRAEGQRLRNFVRPVSMDFSSREPNTRDFRLMQECSTKERSKQYAVLYFFYSEE
ncbi:hypothetical protein GW17_00017993 [Ensete ventricosum]|nr:hypothetical protein GW17_00017993 [Ensete ventricosum]